ncbi:hypothetical protein Q0Z83_017420 [Actinoplanes sichuanensis]|nr:hypothetical protein Q0Z83_017420 [Actinoplanes sichuanensis]
MLVEPGEDPLGQHVTELLTPCPVRVGERIVGALQRVPDLADRPQGGVTEQEEPVLVVDLREERVDPVGGHRQRAPADEGVLQLAGLPVGVADHRVVREAAQPQADPVVDVEQRDRTFQVGRVRHDDVVVEEDHIAPPGHPGQRQPEIAFGARVGLALQMRAAEHGRRLQHRHVPHPGRREVDRDHLKGRQPSQPVRYRTGPGVSAGEHQQRGVQQRGQASRLDERELRPAAGDDDRVDGCPAVDRPGLLDQAAVGIMVTDPAHASITDGHSCSRSSS